MYEVVGIRFKKAGKIYYFEPDLWDVKVNDDVIVETIRGIEFGKAVVGRKRVNDDEVVLPLKKVLRIANDEDREQLRKNQKDAKEAFQIALEKVDKHQLDMKLIDVEYTLDRNKIIFYFTSDGRVDFRELVKDLAAIFRTRIELRQIGVRDEAKMLGGIGPCGRTLCCSTFLGDFIPVSIKMAKDQNLSLNPAKISGLCGRLMCCLKYENDHYESTKEDLPDIGEEVSTTLGPGKVVNINIFHRTVEVLLFDSQAVKVFPVDDIAKGIYDF